jgi:hypothetical protein
LEFIAEREFRAPRRRIDSLRALARDVRVSLHGVSLGLASSVAVSTRRLARLARLVERIEPDHWSEHLAFVRAGGVEIGHLAAAPYTQATLDGTLNNLRIAHRIVGELPDLENIATPLPPPGSSWSESEFVSRAVLTSGAPMLVDLHNLYANAANFGHDPIEMLRSMPLSAVHRVHVSGGHWTTGPGGRPRLIDDHVHDPPPIVYQLLEALAESVPQSLTVIIERDGRYPDFPQLLGQLDLARAALARGRGRRREAALAHVA